MSDFRLVMFLFLVSPLTLANLKGDTAAIFMAFIYQMITLSIAFENTVFLLIPKENGTITIGSVWK
jgi:hypothetical protein